MSRLCLATSLLLLCLFSCVHVCAQDDSQFELRLNPAIDTCSTDTAFSSYPFLKTEYNRISLNGADWGELMERFDAAARGERLFSIVYLGDSHVQADFNVAEMRRYLSDYIPLAGRGLIVPFKLAATNQPLGYTLRTTAPYVMSKLMKQPWPAAMPFTGIGLQPEAATFSLDISCCTPFSRLRILHKNDAPAVTGIYDEVGGAINFRTDSAGIFLDNKTTSVRLALDGDKKTVIGGIELMADSVGLVIHSIGNNGATYSSYGLIEGFGSQLAALVPDMIVIDLGTNEAFGGKSRESIENDIDNLLFTLRRHHPDAGIVLVSPPECFKKSTRRYKDKKGRWRRKSIKVVNMKVHAIAGIITEYAEKHGIACYNRNILAGGEGAAKKMQEASLLGRDGVHYTQNGYVLWGRLTAMALIETLSAKKYD